MRLPLSRSRSTLAILAVLAVAAEARAQAPADAPAADVAPPVAAEPAPPPPPPPVEAAPMAPPPAPPAPAAAPSMFAKPQPPLKIETPNNSTIRFGLLLQPQFQALSSDALDGYALNLYLRRTRILVGGTLFGVLDYFVDTDYPNLFLASNTAPAGMPPVFLKNSPGMNIQDAFVTYKPFGDVFKVDAGFMLPPLAHNAVQGATTLYSWDYFAYTFQSGTSFGATTNPVGRDLGTELRGLVVGNHLEYRLGLFQGLRDNQSATEVNSRNFFRLAGRVQVNLLDAEPGFFYAGTYLGAKKILSLGGSFDLQSSYRYFAGDAFVDLPLGPGVFTTQVNVAHWDGHAFIPTLVKQTAVMGEIGYNFAIGGCGLSPIFEGQHLWVTNANDQTRLGGGLAFWPYGHNSNVKLFYTNLKIENAPRTISQINLQWQLYFF